VRRTGLIAGDNALGSVDGAALSGSGPTFRLAGFGANLGWLTDGAPAAASMSGCVTVAANARLRAAAQSLHSFVPEGTAQPQMRHFFIRELPDQRPGSKPVTTASPDMIMA
jgi:hypothetical protein